MKKYIILILTGLMLVSACNEFLEEPTSKTTSLEVKTIEQLDALLANIDEFFEAYNDAIMCSTDDYEMNTELFDANPQWFFLSEIQYMMWDIEGCANNTDQDFWNKEYKKIFTANMVLENLNKVSGDEAQKAELAAEAHLIRAYSYISLAKTYCLFYTGANKDELGLPLKQSVSFEELNSRNTLGETYELIEADLKAAENIKRPFVSNGRTTSWRGNTAAVNAIYARYWLNRNDYKQALDFANKALKEYNVLTDYNTDMRFSEETIEVIINNSDPDKRDTVEIFFPCTMHYRYWGVPYDMSDIIFWKETYFCRLVNGPTLLPSKELIDLYEKNPYDLRYKYHVVKHYSYFMDMVDPAYDWPAYQFHGEGVPDGPTVGEMYLIKAECLARQNKVSEAMTALNTLRKARIDKDHYSDETAANKEEAVRKILNERRREMPFAARWADIRRYNNNEDPNDDVVLKKIFYPFTQTQINYYQEPIEYVLEKDSRRWANPIPTTEIISSNGKIKQNTY